MYDNLIYLLVVIVIFSTKTAADPPQLPFPVLAALFALKGAFFWGLVRRYAARIHSASQYFSAQQKVSVAAIVFFAADIYLLSAKYFLARIPGAATFPSLLNLLGLCIFFLYLAVLWAEEVTSYRLVFGREQTKRGFVWSNFKTNLPIVLPWLSLSVLIDVLHHSPIPYLNRISQSKWGEPLVFLIFFALLALILPAMVQRLWNCRPLPAGATRAHLEAFCRQQHFGYAEIMLWPLFEGRVLSAGVMGLVKRFRYVLITPALLQALSLEELEAVMAHEIGHIKNRHLFLYLLFFLGFALLAGFIADPLWYLMLNSNLFYTALDLLDEEPSAALSFMVTVPIFLFMILYFRYVFGFFMRNFERQADLHVFKTLATSRPLVRALEKIAWLSGNIRDLPSWHHFGIGQRVDYLQRCEQEPALVRRHDRKVRLFLLLYVLVTAGLGLLSWKMPLDSLVDSSRGRFAEAVLERKIKLDPDSEVWYQLLGDLQQDRKLYGKAIAAYEKALALSPEAPETLNNLAWLLATAEETKYRDPSRALVLAEKAARLKPSGYILDTLAQAYWTSGMTAKALEIERLAIQKDPEKEAYYRSQMEKFAAPGLLPPEYF